MIEKIKIIKLVLLFLTFCNVIVFSQNKGVFVDERDGKEYKFIKIGEQVWMAENLAYLPSVYSIFDDQTYAYKNQKWDMQVLETPFQFVPDYDGNDVKKAKITPYYKKYGVLYNYASAVKSCPAGWHLPSDQEWKELENFIGLEKNMLDMMGQRRGKVGIRLKSTLYWNDKVKGTDDFGFCAIPAGIIIQGDDFERGASFMNQGEAVSFWTSTEYETIVGKIAALRRSLDNSNGSLLPSDNMSIIRYPIIKSFGLCVRCIKNE